MTHADISSSKLAASSVTPQEEERILVLDFGSQTAQLIARRIREQNVFCQLVRHDLPAERIRELAPKGLILSGGPASVYGANSPHPDPEIFELGIPILGICYGMQLACLSQGSKVTPGQSREFGRTSLRSHDTDVLFQGIPLDLTVWMSHGDQVEDLSNTFPLAGRDRHLPLRGGEAPGPADLRIAISSGSHAHRARRAVAFQLCHANLRLQRHLADQFPDRAGNGADPRTRRPEPGDLRAFRRRGFLGHGGSALFKALGPQLSCIFVDNGLLRKGEAEEVRREFGDHFQTDLHVVDARARFLERTWRA